MTPLESELMKFVEKWRKELVYQNTWSKYRTEALGKAGAISDMLTELELILSIEKEKNK